MSEEKNPFVEDIFDKIMLLPVLRLFYPLYKKHKEVLLYLFFGGLAFIVSISTFYFFNTVCGLNELVANVISWIITVSFAFLTNRKWVFKPSDKEKEGFWGQALRFFSGRIFTLIVEEVILFVFVTRLSFDSLLIKVIAQIVVIVLNYIISKLFVF